MRASGLLPTWSPDGAWIAAVTADADARFGLYAIPSGGGEPRLVLRLEGLVFSPPASKD